MITVGLPGDKLRKLGQAIAKSGRKLTPEIAIAINATAKKAANNINKQIREELPLSKAVVAKVVKQNRKASTGLLQATVDVKENGQIPLRDFGARQVKRGVSYKTSKKKGRKLASSAFQGARPGQPKPSWGGRVFKRTGATKTPIQQLWGPSPWGVFVKRKLKKPTLKETRAELSKQLDRRIRFNVLKASGAI